MKGKIIKKTVPNEPIVRKKPKQTEEIIINSDEDQIQDTKKDEPILKATKKRIKRNQPFTMNAYDEIGRVAFGQRTTLNQLFALIREEVARHRPEAATATPVYRDFRVGDVRHSLADIGKAQRNLGYRPQFDVRQGLRLAGDWYAAHL